jgi:hypothetical protein
VPEEAEFDGEVCVAGGLLEAVIDDVFVKETAPGFGSGVDGISVTSAASWYTSCHAFSSSDTTSPLTVADASAGMVVDV